MYNLLVVDDEPLITDSLFDLFAVHNGIDFNVMKAYSGREALGWMEKARVDILLTDISMPDINGLDVHRHVSVLWPDSIVIYLTSFNDFEYVQQAIRNDGEDYILKTEGDGAVLCAVEKAVARLEGRRRDRLLVEQARNSLSLAMPLLQSKFISSLAEEAVETGPEELDAQLIGLQIPLRGRNPVLMTLGQADDWPVGYTTMEKMKRLQQARSIMETFFTEAVSVCAVHERNRLILLMQPCTQSNENMEPEDFMQRSRSLALQVNGSLDTLQALCRDSCGVSLSFAASASLVCWDNISGMYDTLRLKLHEGASPGYARLLYFDQCNGESPAGKSMNAQAYLEIKSRIIKLGTLRNLLESGDRDGFMELYDTVMGSFGSQNDASHTIRVEAYYRMATILMEYLNKWNVDNTEGYKLDTGKLIDMEGHASWEDAVEYFRLLAMSLFDKRHSESSKNVNRIFSFIREYTQKNIGEDLSLTKFASLLNFHPFYLSKLFKQITGKTLSEYVSEVKNTKAKELLGGTHNKVSDISAALGFMTSSYFTSFFRKHTGLSPVEYRNSIGWNEKQ